MATDEFGQLRLRFTDPVQHDYEVIRPIVLHSETVTERSRQTEIERTVVGDKARRFVQHGMLGLVDQRAGKAGRKAHRYPEPVAAHILYLKQLYPSISYREIVRIVARQFGYKTNHHTVKAFLDRHPIPVQLELTFTTFHDFDDAYQARWTVVRMHSQGWTKKSIAGCLKLSRKHVHTLLEAFEQDGFAGLEDHRTRPANHAANQMTLPFLKEVLDLQQAYPQAGRFRIHGLLSRDSDQLPPSERTVGRAMAHNRAFHDAPLPQPAEPASLKHLPYRPAYRHHIWYCDVRYLVKLEGRWLYSICILEGYSRTILAGLVSEHQDLTTILQLLFAALSDYGCPTMIVTDNAKVFKAHDYRDILTALAIEPCYIEKGKPWQNLIESQFKVQLRLADAHFAAATSLAAVQARHAEFIETFNTTPHWAHRQREDGLRTPVDVLSWVRGQMVDPEQLRRLFRRLRFSRVVNRHGFVSIQRFYLYAERGLARQRVAVWIYDGQVHIEYQKTRLAQYQGDYDPHQKRLQAVDQPTLHPNPFASPQLELFTLDESQWLQIRHRPYERRQRYLLALGRQLSLPGLDAAIFLACYLIADSLGSFFFPYM